MDTYTELQEARKELERLRKENEELQRKISDASSWDEPDWREIRQMGEW